MPNDTHGTVQAMKPMTSGVTVVPSALHPFASYVYLGSPRP